MNSRYVSSISNLSVTALQQNQAPSKNSSSRMQLVIDGLLPFVNIDLKLSLVLAASGRFSFNKKIPTTPFEEEMLSQSSMNKNKSESVCLRPSAEDQGIT